MHGGSHPHARYELSAIVLAVLLKEMRRKRALPKSPAAACRSDGERDGCTPSSPPRTAKSDAPGRRAAETVRGNQAATCPQKRRSSARPMPKPRESGIRTSPASRVAYTRCEPKPHAPNATKGPP